MKENTPKNHGKSWTEEDRSLLMKYLDHDYSIEVISNIFKRTTISVELMVKKTKIDQFLKERKIKKLIHFTDGRNLESISKHGLLPVKTLKEKNIQYYYNDDDRYDDQLGGISVSITSRNKYLLRSFHSRKNRKWIEIEIDSSVAKTHNCLFYYCNAASSDFRNTSTEHLSSFLALQDMFSESISTNKRTISRDNKASNLTTDDQAEIIVKWKIPKAKLLCWREINV
jgi:hypothetical protein